MGCGKSKHDVVAGNTVSQSKKSKDDLSNNGTSVGDQAPRETTTNPSVQQEANAHGNGDINAKASDKAALAGPTDGNVKQGEKAEAGQEGGKVLLKESESKKADVDVVIKESKNVNDEKAKETKVVTIAEDLKGKRENEIESNEVGGTKEEELGQGKMIPSDLQSHLNDGTIEGIITDGLSGTTVYYSPPHTNTKEEEEEIPKPDNVIMEEKESVEETKKETTNGL